MSTATAPTPPPVDLFRWPDLRPVRGAASLLRTVVARRLFEYAAARVDVRVARPDGSVTGPQGDAAPLMRLHRPEQLFARVGRSGLIGFGESYMAGDWDAPDLAGLLTRFAAQLPTLVPEPWQRLRRVAIPARPSSERNTPANARNHIGQHYDLSNELFALFLDETMSYSGALFEEDTTADGVPGATATVSRPVAPPSWSQLAAAQRRKTDRLLDLAGVDRETRLLEIGSGWGELAIRAAERGASVLTVTLSEQQQALTRERVAAAGQGDRVRVELRDYRDVRGEFDAIVSVEMIEAVGHQYWRTYFEALDRLLAPGGRVALQAITMPHDRMLATRNTYTWVHKYIFPGGFLPSTEAIRESAGRHTALRVVDRRRLGGHYAETLRLWDERFTGRREEVAALGFDEVFRRMWHFYLEYSRAGFASGYLDVQQVLLERDGDR
ncbi:MAG TPA: cyclopropane-fatty-acyl-phospholipid synthase family protein [Segeticoccus sp.]|nr:cyclopropane-fatty-acyl-phospholipid synthase family protein [Segeticoccus sp.]